MQGIQDQLSLSVNCSDYQKRGCLKRPLHVIAKEQRLKQSVIIQQIARLTGRAGFASLSMTYLKNRSFEKISFLNAVIQQFK
jgi:hypothetical protein